MITHSIPEHGNVFYLFAFNEMTITTGCTDRKQMNVNRGINCGVNMYISVRFTVSLSLLDKIMPTVYFQHFVLLSPPNTVI